MNTTTSVLIVALEPKRSATVMQVLTQAGLSVQSVSNVIPGPNETASVLVVVPSRETDLDLVVTELRRRDTPLILVSPEPPHIQGPWVVVHPDAIDSNLVTEVRRASDPDPTSHSDAPKDAVWTSDSMQHIQEIVRRVAPTTIPVLITGESGTGKEVVARALHMASQRSRRRLVVVDCAAIPPTLMESELFGHRKGAFTGASTDRKGLVAAAHRSTFFLDEIGELPPPVQVKLLRLLQDGGYRRLGGTEGEQADLRIIAATNRNLEEEVERGRFRADLFHRLNGCHIHIPPLRDRRADIGPLLTQYLGHFARAAKRTPLELTDDAREALSQAPWAGNVRELVNCAHYIASLTVGDVVRIQDLPPVFQHPNMPASSSEIDPSHSAIRHDLPYMEARRAWLDLFETEYIQHLLEAHDGNVSAAARAAQMDRRSIQRMLKRMGLDD